MDFKLGYNSQVFLDTRLQLGQVVELNIRFPFYVPIPYIMIL